VLATRVWRSAGGQESGPRGRIATVAALTTSSRDQPFTSHDGGVPSQSRHDGRFRPPSQEEGTLATATASTTKLRPLGDRVVVQPIAREEMTKSGIVLPDTAKEKPQEGKVIAAGPGRILDDGKREAMDVKKGDKVLYAKYAGTEFKVEGDELLIVSQKDILAIVED
jgi:chaperonin GroES